MVITDVQSGSPAEDASLQRGDNHKPVATVNQFVSAVRQAGKQAVLLLVIDQSGNHLYVAVEPR